MDELETVQQREVKRHLATTVKQTGIVFIARVAGYALGLVNYLILAKLFGAKVLGEYSLVLNTISLVTIITLFGLNVGLVKYIPRYRVDNNTGKILLLIKTAIGLGLLFSVICGATIFLLRKTLAINVYHDDALIIPFMIGSVIIITSTLINVLNGVYRGFKDIRYFVIYNEIIRKALFSCFLLALVFLSLKDSVSVLGVFLLISILAFFILFQKTSGFGIGFKNILIRSREGKDQKRNIQRELLRYTSTMVFIAFMGTVLHRVDKIMIGIYKSSELVGIYATADRIGTLSGMLLLSSNVIFSSIIAELYYEKKLVTLESLYRTITKWLIILTLPIIVTFVAFSKVILAFFGEEFIGGSSCLIVLSIAQMINTASGANGWILSLSGREKLLLYNNLSMIVINIVMNSILIPRLGILGAGIATGASIAIVNIVKTVEVKVIVGLFPYDKRFVHIILNLIATVVIAQILRRLWSNIVAVLICILVNIAVSIFISYLFKDESDRFIYQKFITKLKRK